MPANPGFVADTRVSAGRITPNPVAPVSTGLTEVAQAFKQRADYDMRLLAQRADRIDQLELLTATVGAKRELAEFEAGLVNDPDWRTQSKRYKDTADQVRQKYAQQIAERIGAHRPEDAAFYRARFEALIDDDVLSGQTRIGKASREREQKEAVADLDTLQEITLRSMAQEPDPAKKAALAQKYRGAIWTMQDTGQLDPVEAGKRDRGFRADAAEQEAQALITRDPVNAWRRLSDPAEFPDLPGDRRERWARQALGIAEARQQQAVLDEERANRRADRALAKAGEEAGKELDDMHTAGTLTVEAVQARRHLLTEADYRLQLKRADPRSADILTDPETYGRLLKDADTRDVTSDVLDAIDRRKLKPDDGKTILTRSYNAMKDDRPASPYKRGRELIKTTLDPGQLLSGPAAALARSGMANALDEFDSWIEANPNATSQQVLTEARGTLRRFQAIAYEQMSLSTGLPRHYQGTRQNMTTEALDRAMAATMKALDSGKLDEQSASRDLSLIEQWREILRRKIEAEATERTGGQR